MIKRSEIIAKRRNDNENSEGKIRMQGKEEKRKSMNESRIVYSKHSYEKIDGKKIINVYNVALIGLKLL